MEVKLSDRITNCMLCGREMTEEDVYCSEECWNKAIKICEKLKNHTQEIGRRNK